MSMDGYRATSWTADPKRQIFTGRLRVVETAYESPAAEEQSSIKVDVVIEDPSNGELFAAAPYTGTFVVQEVLDSSRFFALTVRDPKGNKVVIGIGFEDRSDALDLRVALQQAQRALGLEKNADKKEVAKQADKDYSLKEGETITVNIGSKLGRRRQPESPSTSDPATLQSFALPPPPSAASGLGGAEQGGGFSLPPPPTADDVKKKRRSLRDLGFDDGQFGEFR